MTDYDKDLVVRPAGDGWQAGFMHNTWPCAVGRSGLTADKREGDGATPIGRWPLRKVLYRADRLAAPTGPLAATALTNTDGWCDDPNDPRYNRAVRLPYAGRHEELWRDDAIYDVIVILGHNDDPPVPGLGSAIFLHLARPDYSGTEGCVALAEPHLRAFLAACDASSAVRVELSQHTNGQVLDAIGSSPRRFACQSGAGAIAFEMKKPNPRTRMSTDGHG